MGDRTIDYALIGPLALYALLAAGDIISTMIGLRRGAAEAHPVMARLFERFGPLPTMLVLKGGIFALTAYAVPAAAASYPWIVWGPLVPAAVHAYALQNNLRVLRDN